MFDCVKFHVAHVSRQHSNTEIVNSDLVVKISLYCENLIFFLLESPTTRFNLADSATKPQQWLELVLPPSGSSLVVLTNMS